MRPIDAKNFDDVANKLTEDNFETRKYRYSIMCDGSEITLSNIAGDVLSIPKDEFDELIAWYQRDQPTPEAPNEN